MLFLGINSTDNVVAAKFVETARTGDSIGGGRFYNDGKSRLALVKGARNAFRPRTGETVTKATRATYRQPISTEPRVVFSVTRSRMKPSKPRIPDSKLTPEMTIAPASPTDLAYKLLVRKRF